MHNTQQALLMPTFLSFSEAEPANRFTQATGFTGQFSCGNLPPGGPQERAAGEATPA